MKTLFIGCGSIGLRHIKLLKDAYPDIELIAYRTSYKNEDLLKTMGVRTFRSLKEALAEKPDCAFVTNPSSMHVGATIKIMDDVKYIFIEKPISTNLQNIHKLQKASKNGNVFLVGYVLRHHPVLLKVKELLGKGVLGKIVSAEASVGKYLPEWRTGISYDDSHTAKNELSGGILFELSHELDYVHWLLGMPSKVFCTMGKFSDLPIETEDMAEIILQYKDKIARVHLDYLQKKAQRTGKIVGTKGTLSFDLLSNTIIINTTGEEILNFPDGLNKAFASQLSHFLDLLHKKGKPLVPLEEGIKTLRIALAAKQSHEKNKIVDIKLR